MADAKMKSGTFTVRNPAPGVRGFHDASDGYLELEPKGSASGVRFTEPEYESALRTGLEITAGEAAADDDEGDDVPPGAKAYNDITAKDIKAHLDAQNPPVAYESDANKAALYALYAGTFEQANAGGVPPTTPAPDDTLDKMSDADLRDTAVALVGADKVPADADRETLLKLARGEAE